MPCKSDYMNPSQWEVEGQRVAGHLRYALQRLGKEVPEDVEAVADDLYGEHGERLDEHTRLLCSLLNSIGEDGRERVIYNAHDRRSRALANWWEDHQEADQKRQEEWE